MLTDGCNSLQVYIFSKYFFIFIHISYLLFISTHKFLVSVYTYVHNFKFVGKYCFQIVTDFDLTLTKQHVNGKKVLSSFGM